MAANDQKLLADLESDNADVRYAAWDAGGKMDPSVIPELAKLISSAKPGVAKAATEALNRLVHSVGKEPSGARRAAVCRGLISVAEGRQSNWVRSVALRHLSAVGGDEAVASAAKLISATDLREEAVFCLERIPGPASTAALMAAAKSAADDFKPRLLAALGHRGDKEAADLCAQAMSSSNIGVALAGMKALARIGVKPSVELRPPSPSSLDGFQLLEFADCILRYADGLARSGAPADAVKLYQFALSRPDEHLQCAATVGLAKMGTAEAAALIFPLLKSSEPKVRRTARKVWDSMKGADT